MNVTRKFTSALLVPLVVFACLLLPNMAVAQSQNAFGLSGNPHNATLTVPINSATLTAASLPGTLSSFAGGTFNGVFNIQRFANQAGQLVANGTLVGTVTNNGVTQAVVAAVTAPVSILSDPPPSCSILSLNVGAINLNLLGLVITTQPIVVNITAQPGPGNLLGNLLCSVAGLLNNTSGLATLLNGLLTALGL